MNETSLLKPLVRVIDDNSAVRRSECFLVKMAGWEVIEFESAQTFLENDDHLRPGCIILDVRMPDMSGLELQSAMKEQHIDLPIIFLTGHGDIDMAVNALKNGANDFLVKPPDSNRLKESLQKAINTNVASRKEKKLKHSLLALYNSLTSREKDVIHLVAKGLLNKVIAAQLGVSEQTIKMHRASACQKLMLRSAVEINDFLHSIDL